ncbi:hypothetical protein HME9302_02328 [Alteripontixanthobacter maritimus]|uniref:M23ase beta-sheet core domain-containing protein n=1 Tax=Alteripontixanthobacter maritimus TaxID=2161824 RepID=A0A369QDW1_9SPHN|nr:peptidoglycan DD-metalloendopeptidase family protein [Alteripontixanthobacter maritimus]RDC61109.1 hypothetical protein HME9302_02328 [Alteripontixanthobacter maritimus]
MSAARTFLPVTLAIATLTLSVGAIQALAQTGTVQAGGSAGANTADTQAALARAQAQAARAAARGAKLEQDARAATTQAEKTGQQAAALAARIQESEAGIDAAQARMQLVDRQRRALSRRLAERQEPLVRLTAALQKFARRPLVLSALRPGSLRETVYLRAVLDSTVPQVRDRTAALRQEILRGRRLRQQALVALNTLQEKQQELEQRRRKLAALESRQRLESRRIGGVAARESERALALAEEARDLDALMGELDRAGTLRADLAALPGPLLRPRTSGERAEGTRVGGTTSRPADPSPAPPTPRSSGRPAFQLPVVGRTVAGFGSPLADGTRNNGLSLAPADAAQIVAPAAGRVVFAGPYRGYDRIVIIEHAGGWTSLVTGMARTDVGIGAELVKGAPIGVAGTGDPVVTLEVRNGGSPVNPLSVLGG